MPPTPSDGPSFPKKFKGPKKQLNLLLPDTLVREIDKVAARYHVSRTEFFVYGMDWVVEFVNARDSGTAPKPPEFPGKRG